MKSNGLTDICFFPLIAGYADTHHYRLKDREEDGSDEDDDDDEDYMYPYSNLRDYRRSRLFTLAHQPLTSEPSAYRRTYYGKYCRMLAIVMLSLCFRSKVTRLDRMGKSDLSK